MLERVSLRTESGRLAAALFLPDCQGPSPALVLCHGAFEAKESLFGLCEALRKGGLAALALDMSCHGESDGERWHVDIGDWAKDLQTALDFLERLPRVDGSRLGAFGFSSGGTAVLEAALVDPRIKALAVLAATVRNVAGIFQNAALRLLVGLGRASLALRGCDLRVSFLGGLPRTQLVFDPEINRSLLADPWLRTAYAQIPFPGSAGCYFTDTLSRVAGIKAPSLVLHGEEDRLAPPRTARLLYEALGCEKSIEMLAESGHAAHLDRHRGRVSALVLEWMRGHLGSGQGGAYG